MQARPPVTGNESQRLAQLRGLEVLDTGPEFIFDALAKTATEVCGTPIALLNLVDTDRLWIKACIGIGNVRQVQREESFCTHAILQDELLEVEDASEDARFFKNPQVRPPENIRFYAGAPITLPDGHVVGTLCVLDRKPKVLDAIQRSTLSNLAAIAAQALVMRKKALELDRINASLLEEANTINSREILYQAIVEDQTDLISLALPNGELTFVNHAYAAHFGKQPAQMVGTNLIDYVLEFDRPAVKKYLADLCKEPGASNGENRMQSAGGDTRWIAWVNRAIGDATGKVIGLHSVGRDITDRKRIEMDLQATQVRYRSLYEATPAMMHSIDQEGKLLFVSDKWLQTLGYERIDVIGHLSTEFMTLDSRVYAQREILPTFFETGVCEDVPYQMVCKDGKVVDVLLSAVLQRSEIDNSTHSLAVLEDVTERNAIRKNLREKEERLELATTANEIGIWELDLISGRLEWTDTMFAIFGGSREEFSNSLSDWSRRVHPDDLESTEQAFELSIQTLSSMNLDFRVIRADGSVRYVNARAVVVNDTSGKPTRVIGTNHDITDRKLAAQALSYSEKRLRTISDNLPVLISHIDKDYRYTFANRHYQTWYSLSENIEGKTVAEVFGDEVFKKVEPRMTAALNGESMAFELVSEIPNSPKFLMVHYIPDRDADGVIHGVFGMVQDRTEKHLARERLKDSEHQLRAITDGLPVLISYIDPDERVQFMNATARDWLGIDPNTAKNKPLNEVIGDGLYQQRKDQLHSALNGQRIEFTVVSKVRDQTKHLQTTYIPDIRESGEVKGVFALSTDVTALKLAESELQRMVLMDPLTGLPNRRFFDQKLPEAIARSVRTGRSMAVLFLDIDHFKSINDSLGHGVGDSVLVEFSNRVQTQVRAADFAARLAGDEFVVILEDLNGANEAETVALKLLAAIRKPMVTPENELFVTSSMGIALNDAKSISPDELIHRADKALYRSKKIGRDTYSFAETT
ncbi:PAS domain S-box protein [Rhodoferax mekongensis]|uniref:PAS domain S-box protein n=1 Tax=Rhodoferax mekongensis TaxID=3068341 RepID=UPI0028BD75D8|nr:PAS domain S-box protein [Rhodoferax sp. TBRC 17199]MDT7517033.1 PAS domain S-box protein [Rhodoferax sp. TBRC 17199]